ncbi:MAG TPA: hypothetical protein VK209_09935, partial [Candidatus Sulfotelmatobacter sp.]|nr:hypothetical protein [Candidatus Sulfotelmatobacter sp.]
MQISKNMAKTTAIIVTVLFIASAVIVIAEVKPAQAQMSPNQPYSGPLKAGDVANGTFQTETWISVTPRRVGVGQTVLVNVWSTPASNAQRKLLGYHITITKPDGTKDEYTLNSEVDTAATWMQYVP